MRKRMMLAAAALAVAALAPASTANAASGGLCQLDGLAKFDTPLGSTAADFTYSFTGDLTNCQGYPTAPASGKVSAGTPVTLGGVEYTLPKASGNGGCSSSTTTGLALVQWSDGSQTFFNYETTGATAAVALTGDVVDTVTLARSDGTGSTTFASTAFGGHSAGGLLAFDPPNPDGCVVGGVYEAAIHGVSGLGAQ